MIDEKKAQTLKVIKLSLKGLARQGVFPQSDMDEFQAALDSATDYFSSDGISPDEYQRLAMRTAADGVDWGNVGLGLAGESGEVADAIKKHLYQGHTLDLPHMKEELGDVLWYVALACKCGGFSMADVMRGNIEKLKLRYPDGFSAERSRGRDK